MTIKSLPLCSIAAALLASVAVGQSAESAISTQPRTEFVNYELWPDAQGVHINAHGGGVLFHEGTYYWFGEHKTGGKGGNVAHVGVGCYRSKDLYNWTNAGVALPVSADPASEIADGCIIERPKVIYNATTRQFVMWFHLELKGQGYKAARTALAVADQPEGPYLYLRSLRPNPGLWPMNLTEEEKAGLPKNAPLLRDFEGGQMSRDMTLFVDDDGKAYHITSSEDNGTLQIAELSPDYLSFSGRYVRALPGKKNEAPAICKQGGRYWMISSGCTGWSANAARSAVADSIWGPWKELGNPCRGMNPANENGPKKTWGGQSTYILPVNGRPGAFIAIFDIWRANDAIDGRYVWLPIQFRKDDFIIHWRNTWDLSAFDQLSPCEPNITPLESALTETEVTFSLSATEADATIRYTTDGSPPTAASPSYVKPVRIDRSTRVKAVAEKGGHDSPVLCQDYVLANGKEAPPAPQILLEGLVTTCEKMSKKPKKGRSVGDAPLTLEKTVYPTGLGVHAPTSLTYAVDPTWTRFVARAGLDDASGKNGSVLFVVSLDGAVVALTPVLTPKNRSWQLDVPIPAGTKEIRLEVENGGDDNLSDHADWANAGFITNSVKNNQ